MANCWLCGEDLESEGSKIWTISQAEVLEDEERSYDSPSYEICEDCFEDIYDVMDDQFKEV